MEILEENNTNFLVLTDDGSTTTKTKSSNLNQLLFGYGLFDLLQEGSEIWTQETDKGVLRVIPGNDAREYTIDPPSVPNLVLGAHRKTDLVDALMEAYEAEGRVDPQPIMNLYEEVRDGMVREEVLDPFHPLIGSNVSVRENGWFINGHLLLTYEGEFYHSEHKSRNRSGSVIGTGTSNKAYEQAVSEPDGEISRSITIDGEQRRLTNSEVEFITKALWAVENTPDRR